MKAIVLSAGQGSRLLPLTNELPKCLLPVGKRTTLQWQIEALDQADEIDEIVVITGFMSRKVEAAIAEMSNIETKITTLFNPFYKVADNLASCWIARDYMDDDFLVVNGDSLFETPVLGQIFANANAPVNLTINYKDSYDSDDMKVSLDGDAVTAVGKTLLPRETDAESIGLVLFKDVGRRHFREAVDLSMRDGSGIHAWYLQVIDHLAKQGLVGATDIGSFEWCEIDYSSDLDAARRMTAGWHKLRIVA